METPFLDVLPIPRLPEPAATVPPSNPFVREYHGETEALDPADTFGEMLAELADPEFDEALERLTDEAEAHAELLGAFEAGADAERAERALLHWIEPLHASAEALLDSAAAATEGVSSASELAGRLDHLSTSDQGLTPAFEDFLGSLLNKVKSVASTAVKLAGKYLPIGILLTRLKPLIPVLLRRVLDHALHRVPPALQPAARQLAARFLGRSHATGLGGLTVPGLGGPAVLGVGGPTSGEIESDAGAAPAGPDLRTLQREFDGGVAALMLTPSEELLVAEAASGSLPGASAPADEIDFARDRLVDGLDRLGEGEDPTPLMEQFLPAILPALRIGLRVVGRDKVVKFLARYLGRLIAPMVGPTITPPLSRVIVDAGLRMMSLEDSPADSRTASEAIARLVEDTAAEVAGLSEAELTDQNLLEEATYEAFHRHARTHFPPATLRRPGRAGVWVGLPRRGRRRFLKYSSVLDVTITPEAAAGIRIRGGRSLADFLRDRLGRDGPVQARLHLYQALAGTRAGQIARASAPASAGELHPLTPYAAAALTGDPDLGREISAEYLDELAPLAIGQRLYYLEVPGGRPPTTGPRHHGGPRVSGTTAAIDRSARTATVAVYLGEALAQQIAARLRRREPLGAALAAIRQVYGPALTMLPPSRIRITGTGSTPAGSTLRRWVRHALAGALGQQREAFLAAVEAPADGVTLIVRFTAVSALPGVAGNQPASSTLDIVAGHHRAR